MAAWKDSLNVYRFKFGEYSLAVEGTSYVFKISSNYHEHHAKHWAYMRRDCYWLKAECEELSGVTLNAQIVSYLGGELCNKLTECKKMLQDETPVLRFTSCRNGLVLVLNPTSTDVFKTEVHFHCKGPALLDALDADIDHKLLKKIKKDDPEFYAKCKKEGIPVND